MVCMREHKLAIRILVQGGGAMGESYMYYSYGDCEVFKEGAYSDRVESGGGGGQTKSTRIQGFSIPI